MANITMPKPSRKGAPPAPQASVQNLDRTPKGQKDKVQLSLDPETTVDFKTYAAAHTKGNLSKLFEMVWAHFKSTHP